MLFLDSFFGSYTGCLLAKLKLSCIYRTRPVTCIEGALSNAVLHEKRMKNQQKKDQENAIRSYPRIQNWMKA